MILLSGEEVPGEVRQAWPTTSATTVVKCGNWPGSVLAISIPKPNFRKEARLQSSPGYGHALFPAPIPPVVWLCHCCALRTLDQGQQPPDILPQLSTRFTGNRGQFRVEDVAGIRPEETVSVAMSRIGIPGAIATVPPRAVLLAFLPARATPR